MKNLVCYSRCRTDKICICPDSSSSGLQLASVIFDLHKGRLVTQLAPQQTRSLQLSSALLLLQPEGLATAGKKALSTQVLHEQIKYCFIEIFFSIHTARVNYGNNKMCINKSEDRILRYSVATVSRYVIGGCTYELKNKKKIAKGSKSKHTCALSRESEALVWARNIWIWRKRCFGCVATVQQPGVRKAKSSDLLHSSRWLIGLSVHLVSFACWVHR